MDNVNENVMDNVNENVMDNVNENVMDNVNENVMENTIKFDEVQRLYNFASCNLNENNSCAVDIKIEIKSYDNNKWYYISYKFRYGEGAYSIYYNPIYDPKQQTGINGMDGEGMDGEIIVKNPISTSLVNGLMSKDGEIETGNVSHQQYMRQIMKCISNLWD
jgi:hypothetical protein